MFRKIIFPFLTIFLLIACENDSSTGIDSSNNLAGTWVLQSFTVDGVEMNLDDITGVADMMTFDPDGTGTARIQPSEYIPFTYTVEGNQLSLLLPGEEQPESVTFSVEGNTLTLTNAESDFEIVLVYSRQ